MSKYIDADLLKAEIEKNIKEVKGAAEKFTPNMGFFDAKLSGIYDVMAILDSIQQEQPVEGLDEEIERICTEIEKQNPQHRGLKPSGIAKIARHFAEWGRKKEQERQERMVKNYMEGLES